MARSFFSRPLFVLGELELASVELEQNRTNPTGHITTPSRR